MGCGVGLKSLVSAARESPHYCAAHKVHLRANTAHRAIFKVKVFANQLSCFLPSRQRVCEKTFSGGGVTPASDQQRTIASLRGPQEKHPISYVSSVHKLSDFLESTVGKCVGSYRRDGG